MAVKSKKEYDDDKKKEVVKENIEKKQSEAKEKVKSIAKKDNEYKYIFTPAVKGKAVAFLKHENKDLKIELVDQVYTMDKYNYKLEQTLLKNGFKKIFEEKEEIKKNQLNIIDFLIMNMEVHIMVK